MASPKSSQLGCGYRCEDWRHDQTVYNLVDIAVFPVNKELKMDLWDNISLIPMVYHLKYIILGLGMSLVDFFFFFLLLLLVPLIMRKKGN